MVINTIITVIIIVIIVIIIVVTIITMIISDYCSACIIAQIHFNFNHPRKTFVSPLDSNTI